MKIDTILSQIDLGSYALPEFQRGYVWNREQVRKLMASLYRGYPIGGLLVWVTATNEELTRGDGQLTPGSVNLILDGQQRITTLYGIIKGRPPKFFDGNAASFTGLYFNLKEETFEFYMQQKMKGNPEWVNVTELMQAGVGNYIANAIKKDPVGNQFLLQEIDKLNKIDNIKSIDLHIQQVAGEDKTIDVVVEIFNNVNSGGTKLSKGDLALAKICGQWPEARIELKNILKKYHFAGYEFTLEWLLRCVTVYLTGRPYFSELDKVHIFDFKVALTETDKLIGVCLDHIGSRLGLDHDRVLGSKYAIATMVAYLHICGKSKPTSQEWDKLLYWFVHTFLWGRYAGSTESVLAQDLNELSNGAGIEGLIKLLRLNRGDLTIRPEDFWGWSTGARFYPLLYLLTRVGHSKDFSSGLELSNSLLGKNSTLEVHHIFPKDLLYKDGKSKSIVNALANYAFLTKDTNLEISNRYPEEYLPEYMQRTPGAVESHWIPTNPAFWKLENYEKFLSQRRILLAKGANEFLNSLYKGEISEVTIEKYSDRVLDVTENNEELLIAELFNWMESKGLNTGLSNYSLADNNGNTLAIIDLAWPDGIQTGLSQPLALLIDESEATQRIVNQSGYLFFTDCDSFKEYVSEKYLSE